MAELKHVRIYTDGACSGNPGPGGYGVILRYGEYEKKLSGGEAETTNNRMELTAVIEGLRALNQKCRVDIYSDSKYFIDAVELGWAEGWKRRGWMRNKKEKALNPDLWEQVLELIGSHEVTLHWVKGHSGNPENEECDRMAVEQSKRFAKPAR